MQQRTAAREAREFARADEHAWIYAQQSFETPPPPPSKEEGSRRPPRGANATKYNQLAGWLAYLGAKTKCYRLGLGYETLAAALTRITADVLGKRADVTAVTIDDLPAARWYVGGRAVQRPAATLEITITAGTNTPAQKAAFVEAAFAELRRQLAAGGELEEASYVTVREVPAADWGYGGLTQQQRQLARMRLAA